MGLKSCNINFDNTYKLYYAGQTVRGNVEFELTSPKTVFDIKLIVRGYCHTFHTDHESDEDYFKTQISLVEPNSDGNQITLDTGKHSFPFVSFLPSTVPSSYEGDFGYIRYTVKVILVRPWKFDHEIKTAFTVLTTLDLNRYPYLQTPVRLERYSQTCCLCCKSRPYSITISVPETGFVPGQRIPVTVEVDNQGKVPIDLIIIHLRKNVKHFAQGSRKLKTVINELVSVAFGPVSCGESKTTNLNIEVPPLVSSRLNNCGLLDLEYDLLVKTQIGMKNEISISIPIVIGTIPFVSKVIHLTNSPQAQNPREENEILPAVPFTDIYPDIPIPSFNLAASGAFSIFDSSDNQFTRFSNDEQYFVPRYPVYSFLPLASTT